MLLIVAIDHLTRWIEAKPLTLVTGKHIERLVWEHIVGRFGMPQDITTDNGKHFAEAFPIFCKKMKIRQSFTSICQPQENGQREHSNKNVIKRIERRMRKANKDGWKSYRRSYGCREHSSGQIKKNLLSS